MYKQTLLYNVFTQEFSTDPSEEPILLEDDQEQEEDENKLNEQELSVIHQLLVETIRISGFKSNEIFQLAKMKNQKFDPYDQKHWISRETGETIIKTCRTIMEKVKEKRKVTENERKIKKMITREMKKEAKQCIDCKNNK